MNPLPFQTLMLLDIMCYGMITMVVAVGGLFALSLLLDLTRKDKK